MNVTIYWRRAEARGTELSFWNLIFSEFFFSWCIYCVYCIKGVLGWHAPYIPVQDPYYEYAYARKNTLLCEQICLNNRNRDNASRIIARGELSEEVIEDIRIANSASRIIARGELQLWCLRFLLHLIRHALLFWRHCPYSYYSLFEHQTNLLDATSVSQQNSCWTLCPLNLFLLDATSVSQQNSCWT